MSKITATFERSDVPQWPVGVVRWCIAEVLICTGAILALNVLEFMKKKQLISGFPKGSLQVEEGKKADAYKEGANNKDAEGADKDKKAGDKKKEKDEDGDNKSKLSLDLKSSEDIRPPPAISDVGLTVTGMDEVNDYDFVHMLWLHLLFHVISLGVSFHRQYQSGVIALWAYLHAVNFAAYVYFHVIFFFSFFLSVLFNF